VAEGEFDAIKAKVDDTSKRLAALAGQLEQNAAFQRFNCVLTHEHVETLLTVWSKRLGVRTTKPSLAYLAHRIRVTEQNAVGRLATAIEDAVLRTLVSSAVRTKKLEILEIGTLFGIGLAMLYEHNYGRYDAVHVTAIEEKEPDVLLNIPVTKATFWRNMDMAGIPRENITLIESLSTSDEAIAQAKARKYDVLVIDGDYSYAGVKADFVSYVDLVQRGGFIIFDDYGTQDWPDVKRFVDDEVAADKRVTLVGSDWRTAVFRVVETTNRSRGGPHRNKRLSPGARSRKLAKKSYKKH
jgi:predicted O-methyltransferase YrrM